MKTKRCVAAALFMMIIIAVVGCGKKQNNVKSQFIKDFDLNISKKDCEFEELFNNYEGFPYEGIALYKISLNKDALEEIMEWDSLPYSKEADDFVTSVSTYVELPAIEDGYWKLVDRNPGTEEYTNVSFCVYDADKEIAYLITMDS